jgi:hypothetical protein
VVFFRLGFKQTVQRGCRGCDVRGDPKMRRESEKFGILPTRLVGYRVNSPEEDDFVE